MNNSNSRNDQSQYSSLNDEIDIMELVAVLWGGKWIIVSIVFVFGIASFIFLKNTSPIYLVETILSQPTGFQLQRLQPSKLVGGESFQVGLIEPETVYLTAIAQSNSLFVQKLFWENHTGQQITLSDEGDVQNAEFKTFAGSLKIAEPYGEIQSNTLTRMMLNSDDPATAVELLNSYLGFLDTYAVNGFIAQIRQGYMTALTRLDSEFQSIEKLERLKLEDSLTRLTEARDLAESLNIIETPYEQVENVALNILDNRQYLIGTRALSGEIDSLKARENKPLFAFVPALRDIQRWREQIDLDLQKLDEAATNAHAFVVVSPPESSIYPVKPNKLLILIAVLFTAGILGVIIVFAREGIQSYRARATNE